MDNKDINKIINNVSGQLNMDPDQLQSAVDNGKLNNVLKGMDSAQADKVQQVLADPEASKKILATPQAQALLKKLMGNG